MQQYPTLIPWILSLSDRCSCREVETFPNVLSNELLIALLPILYCKPFEHGLHVVACNTWVSLQDGLNVFIMQNIFPACSFHGSPPSNVDAVANRN